MDNMEKVIKGLEYCIKSEDCRGCIYWEGIGLHEGCPLHTDALTLLKEQEAAYQGAVELLRQKTILFDDAIKRLKEQEAVDK